MEDNLVRLKLSRFTVRDVCKLGDKVRLLHRWVRYERLDGSDGDAFVIILGDRDPRRHTSYRFTRHDDGTYSLNVGYGVKSWAEGRAMDKVTEALVNHDLAR